MSIPVNESDEDIFISTTVGDAIAEIEWAREKARRELKDKAL